MSAARFEGRVAIVTGASRGIGLAIAKRIVAEGGRVCITGRKVEPLAEAAAPAGDTDSCIFAAGAADDLGHQEAAVSKTVERFGRVDVLVNNVGINPSFGPMLDVEPTAMRKMVEVNVIAGIDWLRKSLGHGLGEGGAVVNVASAAGLRPAANIGFYGATKAALMHMTQQLAVELAPRVRVNAVAPAVVRTRFAGPLFAEKEGEVAGLYPMARVGEPEDVAAAVAYLASDEAGWVTGQASPSMVA